MAQSDKTATIKRPGINSPDRRNYAKCLHFFRARSNVKSLGKHAEKHGRKVSDLRETMVAGLRHRVFPYVYPALPSVGKNFNIHPAHQRQGEYCDAMLRTITSKGKNHDHPVQSNGTASRRRTYLLRDPANRAQCGGKAIRLCRNCAARLRPASMS